jgi:thiamine monophosphate synthase
MVAQALRTVLAQQGHVGTLIVFNGHPLFAIGDDGRRFVDGVQVPEAGFPEAGEADDKQLFAAFRRSGGLVGRSVHSISAALKAQEDGADFLVLGTVFPSLSHPGGPAGGLKLVEDVTTIVDVPVIGIGGITPENAGQVVSAGAAGVAVIRAILGDPDPEGAARRLRATLDAAGAPGGGEKE